SISDISFSSSSVAATVNGEKALVAPATIAATITAATTKAASSTATAAATALGARLGLVDGQGAAAGVLAVQGGDGGLGLLLGLHLHEAEALRTAGVAVHDDLRRLHRAVGRKQLLQVTAGHSIAQVADV